MGMNDLLEYLLSISDIQLKRQIEFVLEQLNSGNSWKKKNNIYKY